MTDDLDLGPVLAALRGDPGFLAGRVSAAGAEDAVAARLGLDRIGLHQLLLSRAPARSRFAVEVPAIAEYVGADADELAAVLREVDALVALRGVARPLVLGQPGLVAAAHPAEDDHVGSTDEGVQRLRELAERFWAAAPEQVRRERDVEAAVSWTVLLAVVSLPRLTLAGVREWLHDHDVPVTGGRDDLRLRGFLVAWRGVGVAFCDGTLDAADRRFTLAHEIGHFLLDYELPRLRVLRDVPELLEVVDGIRPAEASDQAQAVLAGVPLGVHTQLLEAGSEAAHAEDEASRLALELLSPWDELVSLVRERAAAQEAYRLKLAGVTETVRTHFGLPEFAARARARQVLDALDVRPGFFER